MRDFKVVFTLSPWILLLLVPAVIFMLVTYFHVEKRFRRMRKRTISLVLHLVILVCAITALSGLQFTWAQDDMEDELVIMVDQSYSERSSRSRADEFVKSVIDANNGRTRYAIVKFGYDQVLAVDMGKHNPSSSYKKYLDADEPNTTATDIRSALAYVWDPVSQMSGGETGKAIISDPKSTRILLISDGLQTDRDALSIAKLMELDGVRIDTTFFPANYSNDAWIVEAAFPDRSFDVNENFEFDVTVRSSYAGTFDLTFSDNGVVKYNRRNLNLRAGLQDIKIPYSFTSAGHHELKFGMTSSGDTNVENNVYYTTYDLEEYNSILIIEKYPGESDAILDIINSRADIAYLTVKVVNIDSAPQTLDGLLMYDEIILVNIAHEDMTTEFEENLYKYVNEHGGGVFTVGGFEKDSDGKVKTTTDEDGNKKPVAHAYNEEDLADTTYQSMLPITVGEYTPPTALAILIDRSASMESNEERPCELAIEGALAAVESMSTRDFVGVMTMQTSYHVKLDLTPMTQKRKIIDAIYRVEDEVGGSNSEIAAIEQACRSLGAMRNVERKHILFLTDGKPGDPASQYQAKMQTYYNEFGITITVISVVEPIIDELNVLAEIGHGSAQMILDNIDALLPPVLHKDLGFEENYEGAVRTEYQPELKDHTPVVDNITQMQLDTITMQGFFVSRVKNSSVKVPLMAKFVPMYAQWKFGEGKVGSLMVDLDGYFSAAFIDSEEVGAVVLNNIISTLMPVMNIREHTLGVEFIEDNYRTQASVDGYNAKSEPDKKLVAFVTSPSGKVSKFDLSSLSPGGNRFTFENFEPGIHDVVVVKVPKSFNVMAGGIKGYSDIAERYILALVHDYRPFSYSAEYNAADDSFTDGKDLLIKLSSRTDVEGEEKLIDSPDELLSTLISIDKVFDPRYLLIGIAVVLFLIEIALRKFKIPKIKRLFEKFSTKKNGEANN